jgi:hypothetical protein
MLTSLLSWRTVMLMLLSMVLAGCHAAPEPRTSQPAQSTKIKFPLDDIRSDGLRGPPDGLVAVSYEFCVPASDQVYQEVLRIDSDLKIYSGSPGRVGCMTGQALIIGETHHPNWREVLQGLSTLTYVIEIRECFFE